MPVLTVGERRIAYTLRRSDSAKRARITVTPANVEVVVPTAATEEQIDGVLHRRRGWLVEQTRQMAARVASAPSVGRFVSGAKVPYRGRLMRLKAEPFDGSLIEVSYRNGFYLKYPRMLSEASRDALIASALRLWLRKRLRADVAVLVRKYGDPNGLRPTAFRIKDQKHMWGSCGLDGIVNLNWQLVFAPRTVLEYAVVHELCHLRHRDHSPVFWNLVAQLLPDWNVRKEWLDRNEHLLVLRDLQPTRIEIS